MYTHVCTYTHADIVVFLEASAGNMQQGSIKAILPLSASRVWGQAFEPGLCVKALWLYLWASGCALGSSCIGLRLYSHTKLGTLQARYGMSLQAAQQGVGARISHLKVFNSAVSRKLLHFTTKAPKNGPAVVC